MTKITLEFPEKAIFSSEKDIMITDLTGGFHVGNHVLISYLTDAQMRFLIDLGFPDLLVDGKVAVNTDLAVNYIAEAHYGDKLIIDIAIQDLDQRSYDIIYRVSNKDSQKTVLLAKMGMIFLDLDIHRVCDVPEAFILACKQREHS